MSRVGPAAFALGFAGLLPQLAAGVLALGGTAGRIGEWLALGYGSLILSFLGGMWWGFAMARVRGQGGLALAAVMPSLTALAIGLAVALSGAAAWGLVALGSALLLTLPVDRHLVRTGEAPANWMALRVPLSVGLGFVTIAIGLVLAGQS